MLAAARADRDLPWPQTTASTWARVRRDGDRTGHEALVAALTHRTSRAVLAALADPDDPALLDVVADAVLLRCEQSSWCWPAHDDTLVPDPARPVLDLGAGEVAGQLAWTDHLLGDRLDERWPGLRARLRLEVRVRVLDPFRQRRDWHWLGLDGDVHNWNPWIHGNVLTAALALTEGTSGPSWSRSPSRASTATSRPSRRTVPPTRGSTTGSTARAARSRRSTSSGTGRRSHGCGRRRVSPPPCTSAGRGTPPSPTPGAAPPTTCPGTPCTRRPARWATSRRRRTRRSSPRNRNGPGAPGSTSAWGSGGSCGNWPTTGGGWNGNGPSLPRCRSGRCCRRWRSSSPGRTPWASR